MNDHITRRKLLTMGGKSLLAGAAGAGLGASLLHTPAHAVDWGALLNMMMPDGFGIVKKLVGEAFADERPLQVGSRVPSGAKINVGAKSRMILSMSDRSIFQFSGPASLELLLSMMRQGILNLFFGAFLAVVPRDNHYLVSGPTGFIGIKGTIFYREVYPREEMTVQGMEGPLVTPPGAKEYFCNCNGEVEYLGEPAQTPVHIDRSDYHHSFYLDPSRPDLRVKAPMVNHTDEEIKALIRLQTGRKHDASWIERHYQKR
ncbi:MAG: hypothetical protein O7E56_07025 [SAR324 cluster bacterium]|nr:hypothetical protein [SAR324 cluster bacterium]